MDRYLGKIYDISMSIHENMSVYKNKEEKKPLITVNKTHDNSSSYESKISMDMHTGTHIDAPLHMLKNGQTMEIYRVEDFITKCKVFDFTHLSNSISKTDLETKNIEENDFILLKTKNSFSESFEDNFIYLDKTGALYLKEKKIKGVGIDALGIERAQPEHETHKYLLESSIMIVEGLRLKHIKEGEYLLINLPLKINNVEAAPSRAILIKKEIN